MMYLGANNPSFPGHNLFQKMISRPQSSVDPRMMQMLHPGHSEMSPMAPVHMAGGGDIHSETEKLDLVHLSPHEAHMLDEIQGGSHRSPDGVRMYSHLGNMMNHPHVHEYLHHASHERRMAAGGVAHMPTEGVNQMAHNGMYHDTEMAYMPRHMQHVLDHMIGGPDHNPIDGKKQYFLGDMLGSIKNAFSNPGQFINSATGAPEGTQTPGWGSLGQMAKGALGHFARSGLQGLASQYGGPQEEGAPGGFYGNMGRSMLGNLAQRGIHAMDNPGEGPGFDFSRQGIMNAGRNALGSAARYGVNKAFDMADRYMQPQYGPEMDHGQGAPGSFERSMGDVGSQYGRRAGSQYGSHYGGMAGRTAGRVAGAVPGSEDYNPQEMSGRASQFGADRGGAYGASAGSQFGSRAGGFAGRLMDRGFAHLDRHFPAQPGGMDDGSQGPMPPRRPSYGRPTMPRSSGASMYRGPSARRPMPINRSYSGYGG